MNKSILDTTVPMGPDGSPVQPTLRELIVAYYVAKTGDAAIGHAAAAEYARHIEEKISEQDPLTLLLGTLKNRQSGDSKIDVDALLAMLTGRKDAAGFDLQGLVNGSKTFMDMFAGKRPTGR